MNAGSGQESGSSGGRTGAMATGLIMGVVALFMAPMSLRETCTLVNRADFIVDELQLEEFRDESGGDSSAALEGHLVSTGEHFVTEDVSIIGLDRLRTLQREKKVEGFRVPMHYLPKQEGFWAIVDRVCQFRVRTPQDFEHGFPAPLVAANIVIAAVSIALIRRGAGFSKRVPR